MPNAIAKTKNSRPSVTAPGGEASTGKRTSGRFQKGQSGNPGGRPRDLNHVRELARSYGDEAIETLVKLMRDKRGSNTGRAGAAGSILDRGYGKPTQVVEGAMNVEYHISDEPMTPDEWLKQYATPETV
jgi:hypothetical protein